MALAAGSSGGGLAGVVADDLGRAGLAGASRTAGVLPALTVLRGSQAGACRTRSRAYLVPRGTHMAGGPRLRAAVVLGRTRVRALGARVGDSIVPHLVVGLDLG